MHKVAGPIPGAEIIPSSSSPESQGVLFEDSILTREEAIARTLVPKPGYENVRPTAERKVKVGNDVVLWLNPTTPFICPQIRDAYKPAHYETIGRSIKENPHGQLQNCGVALNDVEHIEQFLTDLNNYFGSDITIDDLEGNRHGEYYVTTIFGHNRQLGIAAANLKDSGHPDKGLLMRATGFVNPPFWQVISDQATENTGQNPDMWDRARSIVMYKNLRIRDGVPPTQDEMAKIFGVHGDQIWRAERYDALPAAVKNLVMTRQLPYSGAIELHQLNDLYNEEDIILLAKNLADKRASGPQINEEIKKRLEVGNLTPEIRYAVEEGAITLPQAKALYKLSRYVTAEKLNEFAQWIIIEKPSTEETKVRLMAEISRLQRGQMTVFESYDEETMAAAQADIQATLASQQAAQIQRAVTDIAARANSLRTAVGAGLVGDAISGNPISKNASLLLTDQLLGALDNVRSTEADTLRQGLTSIRNYLGSSSNGLGAKITETLAELAELIELEQSQTVETQRQAREEIIRRFGTATTQAMVVQQGLF